MEPNAAESEQRLRLALATGRIGLWVWNSTDINNAGDWSDRLKEIFGVPMGTQVTHEIFLNCVHPDDRERVNECIMGALAGRGGGEYEAEYRTVHPVDKSEHWVTARGQAFFNSEGQPIRFIGTVMEITDRKRTEEGVRKDNLDLEDKIAVRTAELQQINTALLAEIEERSRAERAQSQTQAALECALGEMRMVKERFELAFESIPALVWSALPDGYIDFLNRRWLDFTGLAHESAKGWGWQAAVHPQDLPELLTYWKSIVEKGEKGEYEARLRRFDGVYHWFLIRAVPVFNESGALIKWYGTNTDVEALRASEHVTRGHLEGLAQMLDVLVQEIDPDRLLEHVADMICHQMGTNCVTFWVKNEEGALDRLATFKNREELPAETATAEQITLLRRLGHPVWDEFFRTGNDCVEGDFCANPPSVRLTQPESAEWHPAWGEEPVNDALRASMQQIIELGIQKTLTAPMVISGRIEGLISARFGTQRTFRPEEIDLIRTLAHQAMLMIQMIRLSKQSRETAVVSERIRFARDIHDTLAQGFTGVIMQLQAAKGAAAQGGLTKAAEHIQRAEDLARISLAEARRSVRALRPRSLDDGSLDRALQDLVNRMTEGTPLRAAVRLEGKPREIPMEWKEGLLRIAQECLTNTIRHANAKNFEVTLTYSETETRLTLTDNGTGFDPTLDYDGFGLVGMKERADRIGAAFSLHSAPNESTCVSISLK